MFVPPSICQNCLSPPLTCVWKMFVPRGTNKLFVPRGQTKRDTLTHWHTNEALYIYRYSPCIIFIWFRYGFGKGQRGCNDQNSLHFKFFLISVEGGGGHWKSIFSQIQNSPKHPRKLWTFSTIWDIFFLDGSPKKVFGWEKVATEKKWKNVSLAALGALPYRLQNPK